MYLKDSTGNRSLTATLAVVAFIITMVKVLFSGSSIALGGSSYSFGTIDAPTVVAILGPILGSYTVRRLGSPAAQEPQVDGGGKPGDGAA